MQQIQNYIKALLFIHDCVILPGFGGLISNYHSAEHNEVNNTFDAPKKDILFNSQLTYNDGLLVSYLAKNTNVSFKEADLQVRNAVESIWMQLEEQNEYIFDGLGVFKLDSSQSIIFEPNFDENFLTESYGLSSFRFPPLNYQSSVKNINHYTNSNESMNIGIKQTLKWAAVAIPIIGILTFIPYQKSKRDAQVAGIDLLGDSNSMIESVHSAMPSDTNMAEVIEKSTDKRVALFYTENSTVETTKPQVSNADLFYIIAGSYKDEVNANKHSKIFEKEGYSPDIIHVDGLYRVSLSQYESKVNALHELRRIRNEEQNDNVWLYSR